MRTQSRFHYPMTNSTLNLTIRLPSCQRICLVRLTSSVTTLYLSHQQSRRLSFALQRRPSVAIAWQAKVQFSLSSECPETIFKPMMSMPAQLSRL